MRFLLVQILQVKACMKAYSCKNLLKLAMVWISLQGVARAESLAQTHMIGSALLTGLGSRPTAENDHRSVVALIKHYKKYDNEKQKYVEHYSLCSGIVINESCVLSAGHCVEQPGEITLSTEVFTAAKIGSALPAARVETFHVAPKSGQGIFSSDLAILKLSKPLHPKYSLYEKNLPTQALSKNMIRVGFGHTKITYDANLKEYLGSDNGTRTSSAINVETYTPAESMIVGDPKGDTGLDGDSGGGLFGKPTDSTETMTAGVFSNSNEGLFGNPAGSTKNRFVSTVYFRSWILATLKELNCVPAINPEPEPSFKVHILIQQKFGN